MTLIRHPDQVVATPGYETIEPPAYFIEEAYACGVEPGSGVVRLKQNGGSVIAMIDCKIRGVQVHLRALGVDNSEAIRNLLVQLRSFKNG